MKKRRVLSFFLGLCVAASGAAAQESIKHEISPGDSGTMTIGSETSAPAKFKPLGTTGSTGSNNAGGGNNNSNGPVPGHSTIYVHGLKPFKNLTHCHNDPTCYDGWNAQLYTGSKVRHAGYFTLANPTLSVNTPTMKSGMVQVLDILNKHCRKDQSQSCDMICGSMGCYTISYVLATYNSDQKYSVASVSALASAEGGSEVANIGTGIAVGVATALTNIFGGALTAAILNGSAFGALKTSYARSRWDHNRNNGTLFYHKAGNKPLWPLNWVWSGSHDRMVSFHSACGYRNKRAFTKCGGESETTSEWKWIKVWIRGKWRWRYRKVTTTTHYYPFTGHKASTHGSTTGISGAQHGYMSKTSSAQTKL